MNRCPYCGERYIGNRAGVGLHLSSIVRGAISALLTLLLVMIMIVLWGPVR